MSENVVPYLDDGQPRQPPRLLNLLVSARGGYCVEVKGVFRDPSLPRRKSGGRGGHLTRSGMRALHAGLEPW
jgi:hypothetical protein